MDELLAVLRFWRWDRASCKVAARLPEQTFWLFALLLFGVAARFAERRFDSLQRRAERIVREYRQ